MVAAFSFKIKYGIHHVFKDARTGDCSLFGDMADQKESKSFLFGQFNQFISAGPNLRDTARRGFNFFQVHRLNGVNNNHRGI